MKNSLSILLLAAVFASGCSTLGVKKSDEEVVRDRAQARADALLKGDVEAAWKYTSPTYRQGVGVKAYAANVGGIGNWTHAEVDNVACEENRCDVQVMVTYSIKKFNLENTRPLDEVWIKSDGQWWIFHRR